MNTHNTRRILYLLGFAITLLLAAIAYIAPRFDYGSDMLDRPIIPLVVLLMLAGIVYLLAVSHVRALFPTNRLLITIIAFGLLMRAVLFMSKPILEDDYYRYLWDGGVTANLYNPYAYTPNDVMWHIDTRNPPNELTRLASDSGTIAERVNHASLGTVYPPVAQAAFAIAHTIRPWSLTPWKAVLLTCDIGILLLLILILRKSGLPETRILIYWWNPLLIRETYNAAHMDLVIMIFLILALYCAVRQYTLRTGLALSAAIAAKLWPIVLIPLFLRHSRAL
ncbi:MAG: glycosyltransferase 87 family protein, partial [Candidatus Hydrogenedentota bacterium]